MLASSSHAIDLPRSSSPLSIDDLPTLTESSSSSVTASSSLNVHSAQAQAQAQAPFPAQTRLGSATTPADRPSRSSPTSLSSTTSSNREINPLFTISQRVESGALPVVHLVDQQGKFVQGSTPPVELLHPSTWRISRSVEGTGTTSTTTATTSATPVEMVDGGQDVRNGNGNGNELERARTPSLPTSNGHHHDTHSQPHRHHCSPLDLVHSNNSSNSHSHGKGKARERTKSTSSSSSQRIIMHGEGPDEPAPTEETVQDFKDHDFESSKRDQLRMKAHGWKAGVKQRMSIDHHHSQSKGSTDPHVMNRLGRDQSLLDHNHADDDVPKIDTNVAIGGPSLSTMILGEDETPRRSESPVSLLSPTFSTHLNGTNATTNDSSSSSTIISPTITSSPSRQPIAVVNAPGYLVTNSRIVPTMINHNAPSSSASSAAVAPRLVPMDSLTRPLTNDPGAHLFKSSSSIVSSSMTASSPIASGSRGRRSTISSTLDQTNLSSSQRRSNLPPPIRTMTSLSIEPLEQQQQQQQQQQQPYDEVESSIAAQAEAIRKKRQEKRLAEQQQQQQQSSSNTGAGAPMMKRRTSRMGSGDSNLANGLGAGVLVGNLIGQDHANYVLMYNMLTGIRIGVSRCQAKLKRPLTDADYTARHKFSFDIVGNELTPSVKYDFKFKDYAPWVFRELREYFYLDPSDYLVSLTAKYILSELGSPGKSGSFFYFSRDYRFIIKTIRHAEHKFLRSILKEYHEYIKENPHTLLSRFYGLHRVKLPRGRKIHFVIMNNLFPPHRDIHETYDLKGSAIGRRTPEEKIKENKHAILKDLNWVERARVLDLGPEKKALFEEQLRRDTELMQKLGIMDYSLLTGIHNVQRGNQDNLRDNMLTVFQPDTVKTPRRKPTDAKRDADAAAMRKAVQRSDPKALSETNKLPDRDTSERRMFLFYQDEGGIRATGDHNEDLGVIYYLGIIDILTPYTFVKKVEHVWKSFKHNGHMISAVPPKEYGDRFMAFIYSVIRGNDTSKRPRMYEDGDEPPVAPKQKIE